MNAGNKTPTLCEGSSQPANDGVSDAKPLQGLAAYLRAEAGGTFQGSPNWQTLLQWANEVDAAQSRQPSAQGGERLPAVEQQADLNRYLKANYPNAKGDTVTARAIHALEEMDVALGMKDAEAYRLSPPPAGGGKEALSDAERLDWLVDNGFCVHEFNGRYWVAFIRDGEPVTSAEVRSAREAIDAAIRAGKKG